MTQECILITGGSGKFGRKLIEHFLEKNAVVSFTASNQDSINSVYELFSSKAEKSLFGFVQNFTSPDFAENLVESLRESKLFPRGLVNNARSLAYLKMDKNGLVDRDNFVNEYVLDVVAPYELTMSLALSAKSHLKHVVNISSQYGMVAANPSLYDKYLEQSPIHYGVAKAALVHLTKELAVRLAPNIQVNSIAYGGVEGRVSDDFKERYAKLVPLGRMLTEDEIAGPVDYLLSDMSSGMTGQVISVDGGWGIW